MTKTLQDKIRYQELYSQTHVQKINITKLKLKYQNKLFAQKFATFIISKNKNYKH